MSSFLSHRGAYRPAVRVAILHAEECLYHEVPPGHPECPERLEVVLRELARTGLVDGPIDLLRPRPAGLGELSGLHDPGYVSWVEEVCKAGGGLLGPETWASPGTFEAACHAAGAAIQAAELVARHRYDVVLALVRPPGHHAGRHHARGYCVFNNVALAARHLLEDLGLERVAIIDVDAHHGDGTQEFFYRTDRVLYVSLHQDPRLFPGRGFEDEVGSGEGEGFNVNIPLPFLTGDDVYLKALRSIALPIVRQYRPQAILVSLGLDHHYADPVGRLALSMLGHLEVFSSLYGLARETCGGRIALVLEGGYSLTRVGKMLAADLAFLLGRRCYLPDEPTRTTPRLREKAEATLRKVRRIQSEYWDV